MEEFINEFKAEASGIVSNVQQFLLTLESDRKNRSLVDEVFRGVHSLKGASRMFGFEKIEILTHELENSFDEVRDGKLEISTGLINIGLEVMDAVTKVLDKTLSDEEYNDLKSRLSNIEEIAESIEDAQDEGGLFQVLYFPSEDVYLKGIKPLGVIEELEELDSVQVHILYQGKSFEEQEEEKSFESKFEILVNLEGSFEDLEDVFLLTDEAEFEINKIESNSEEEIKKLAENAEKILDGKEADEDFEAKRKEFIQEHYTEKSGTVEPVSETEEKPAEAKVEKANPSKDTSIDFINVKLDKLDQMMNLLSELVTVKAELAYRAEELNDQTLMSSVERLEKISNKFKDNAFSMRLVPLQILSLKFQRLIRDISTKLGKEVKIITEGLDTEIDKSIISEIEAPLVHIIQNAIDHGLETPEEREAIGKSREGLIKIVAFYAGASVFIMVQDDGKGLNTEKIRQKAISKGLISADAELSQKDILDLIFKPGFTTHSEATAYSGRGVGMDVVMQKIKKLRGAIDVTTEPNLGSAFTIRLPLSLSILDVLQIKIRGINYLIPQSEIEQCFSERLHTSLIKRKDFNMQYKGKLIPHINLINFFELGSDQEESNENAIIVIQKNDELVSLEVEEIVGYSQLVVKPMDDVFNSLPYLTGVSVLGNGGLAFMLDALKLKDFSNRTQTHKQQTNKI